VSRGKSCGFQLNDVLWVVFVCFLSLCVSGWYETKATHRATLVAMYDRGVLFTNVNLCLFLHD
jgi:hypothetical protein